SRARLRAAGDRRTRRARARVVKRKERAPLAGDDAPLRRPLPGLAALRETKRARRAPTAS
ncbi:MAG: hypothetical protein AB1689_19360, partial [Thermodesulfobacteriota bacterium]